MAFHSVLPLACLCSFVLLGIGVRVTQKSTKAKCIEHKRDMAKCCSENCAFNMTCVEKPKTELGVDVCGKANDAARLIQDWQRRVQASKSIAATKIQAFVRGVQAKDQLLQAAQKSAAAMALAKSYDPSLTENALVALHEANEAMEESAKRYVARASLLDKIVAALGAVSDVYQLVSTEVKAIPGLVGLEALSILGKIMKLMLSATKKVADYEPWLGVENAWKEAWQAAEAAFEPRE